jgi:hypothetical protein
MRAFEELGMIARRLRSLRFFAMKCESHPFQIRIWSVALLKISKSVIVRSFGRWEFLQCSRNPDYCQYSASEEPHNEILRNTNSAELLERSFKAMYKDVGSLLTSQFFVIVWDRCGF